MFPDFLLATSYNCTGASCLPSPIQSWWSHSLRLNLSASFLQIYIYIYLGFLSFEYPRFPISLSSDSFPLLACFLGNSSICLPKIQWERWDCLILRGTSPSMVPITATQLTSFYICCLCGLSSSRLLFSSTSRLLSSFCPKSGCSHLGSIIPFF